MGQTVFMILAGCSFCISIFLIVEVFFIRAENKVLKKMIKTEIEHNEKIEELFKVYSNENLKTIEGIHQRVIQIEDFLVSLLKKSGQPVKKEFKN